jgi:diguanylate cyclase (GGDEF)-like protein
LHPPILPAGRSNGRLAADIDTSTPLRFVTPLKPLAVPAAILLVAAIAAVSGAGPAHGLAGYGPYVVLSIGAAIALWFNRGRPFFVLISLLAAYCGLDYALEAGAFSRRAVLTATAVFVPLNCLLALLARERGVFHFRSYRWALLLAVQTMLAAWIAGAGATPLSGTAWHALLDNWLFRPAPTPFVGRLLLAAALAVSIAKSWEEPSPTEVGIGGALVALFFAFTWARVDGVLPLFFAAAGVILLLAVLQESHRMAFRDQLTGLPSRRALEEQIAALGPVYTIAMVDVDHFKKFNDTHGHDVGDQVLRVVGRRLAEIGGGGRPFRYGGEEFSVLFAEKSVRETLPHLEQLREAIEQYRITLRTQDRRKQSRSGQERRSPPVATNGPSRGSRTASQASADKADGENLSVTVSVGVAQRNERLAAAPAVIKAADEALYRAKQAGRNRVST